MARLEVEIGANSKDFRVQLNELPPVVSGAFRKMKQEAKNHDLGESIKGVKQQFNDFKDLLVGGGVVTAVKAFFSTAIDAANKSENANDANAAAVRRFGAAIEEGKSMFRDFAVATIGNLNRMGESVGALARDSAKFWLNWGDGAGNLEESERGVRQVELALAEAKKHAAEFNQLNAQAKQLTEQRAAAEMKSLPLAEQRAVLEERALRAQRAAEEAGTTGIERRRAEVEQMKIAAQLAEVQRQMDEQSNKELEKRRQEREKLHQAELAALEPIERQRILKLEINDLEQLLRSNVLSANDAEKQKEVLASRILELKKTEAQIEKERIELAKEMALGDEQLIRIMELQEKARRGLTEAEKAELDVLLLQSEQKKLQVELSDLLEKKVTGVIKPAEEKHLAELVKQKDTLDKQIEAKEALAKKAGEQQSAEAGLTSEFQKQLAAIREMAGYKNAGFRANPNGAGGEGTTTLEKLEAALANAKSAFEYARNHVNDPGGADNYLRAQAQVLQLENNVQKARMLGATVGGGYSAIPLSQLDTSPPPTNSAEAVLNLPKPFNVKSSGRTVYSDPSRDLSGAMMLSSTAQLIDGELTKFFAPLDAQSATMQKVAENTELTGTKLEEVNKLLTDFFEK